MVIYGIQWRQDIYPIGGYMNQLLIDQEILNIQTKIDDANRAVEEYKIVLKYLEQKRDEESRKTGGKGDKSNENNLLDEFFPPSENKPNFPDSIREIYSQLKDREFQVPNIALLMQKKGIITEINNNVKAKISTILAHDTKKGKLVRTFKGHGNIPHKYKIVEDAQEHLMMEDAESQNIAEGFEDLVGN